MRAALLFGYLCGSIPFGLIITRLAGTRDIRSIGSGNIGATNVLRTGRKGLAAATLVGDALKGTFAVLAIYYYYGPRVSLLRPRARDPRRARRLPRPPVSRSGSASRAARASPPISASCWRWHGRSRIAFCLIWLAVAAITRYSSLAALVASAATPFALWLLGTWPEPALFALLTVLLWIMHRANIARLMNGTEGKIGKTARRRDGAITQAGLRVISPGGHAPGKARARLCTSQPSRPCVAEKEMSCVVVTAPNTNETDRFATAILTGSEIYYRGSSSSV